MAGGLGVLINYYTSTKSSTFCQVFKYIEMVTLPDPDSCDWWTRVKLQSEFTTEHNLLATKSLDEFF